jgi:iron(III) transport system permease protein
VAPARLFVVYPLGMLFARMLSTRARSRPPRIAKILTDRNQIRAFWNSLLLATLVGAARHGRGLPVRLHRGARRLPRWLLAIVDASVLLPLVSPPFTTAIAIIFSFGRAGSSRTSSWA